MNRSARAMVVLSGALALMFAGCGDDDVTTASAGSDVPTIVVSTNILGDVVQNLVGEHLSVEAIMPVGADPHDFQPSAQQVAAIAGASALVVNGASFEEGLLDVIESAEHDGVPVFEAISAVDTIEFGEARHEHHDDHDEHEGEDHDDHDEHEGEDHDDHDEHEGEDHDDHDEHEGEDHDDHDEHDHDGVDPHFFTDPARMAVAADAIVEFLIATVDDIDADALRTHAERYVSELEALDSEVAEALESLSAQQRVLVTNHDVFGYFADRHGFEVVGTVIPGGTTVDAASAQALAELTEVVDREGVPAIFADTSSSDELAQTLADEVGGVAVVELFTESLGDEDSDGATYVEMVRANASRIAAALGG